jgi:hypothetical protein
MTTVDPAKRRVADIRYDVLGIGTPVVKVTGYPFPGEVRAVFLTTKGELRYVIEASGEAYAGLLHIFNPEQIEDARS